MGFIYIIKNVKLNKFYVGQTRRNIKIRWTEHCTKSSNRLLSSDIQKYGIDSFSIVKIEEINNDLLDEKEKEEILKYNSVNPNGYNIIIGSPFTFEDNSKGGSSDCGHDKQSLKVKEKYKNIEKLKDLGYIPRGISYYSGKKDKKYDAEGFKVRKSGIKNKSFIYVVSKNKLKYALDQAKEYLNNSIKELELNSKIE